MVNKETNNKETMERSINILLNIIILFSTSYILLFGSEQLQKAFAQTCFGLGVTGLLIYYWNNFI